MLTLAYIIFGILVALIALQGLLVAGFVIRLLCFRQQLVSNADAPKAAVILCLRGGDPFLKKCIQGILEQDYPEFQIHLVVDHPSDPAMKILRELNLESSSAVVHQHVLTNPLPSCSLKCSSVVQAIGTLDETIQFVALIDADTVPHATWLRELATALQDDKVGAATGNRWYMPVRTSMPALIRYSWNAAAIVQMYWYNIGWGGTLAIKTRVFRETDILDKWSHAFCEDTMLFAQLKKARLRLAFVPSLMMINREDCDLKGFFFWVRRQLLTARLYHPAWLGVASHGVVTTLFPLLALVCALVSIVSGNKEAASVAAWSFVFYQVSVTLMLPPMEYAVRRIVSSRGEPTGWLDPAGVLKWIGSVALTQFVYALALRSACTLKRVEWRGIEYRIGGAWEIAMEKYAPYHSSVKSPEQEDSPNSL